MANKKSALTKSPSERGLRRISPGIYVDAKGQRVNSQGQPLSRRGSNARTPQGNAPTQPTKAPDKQPPPNAFMGVQPGIQGAMQGFLSQMQNQGAFNPGSFAEQQQKAYQNVMDRFNYATDPAFAKQRAEFQQMAAERGLDPSGQAYRSQQDELYRQQETARQEAMRMANTEAGAVGQQAFERALAQYQAPGQMLGQFAPFYGAMGGVEGQRQAQQFEREMNPILFNQKLQEIAASGRASAGAAAAGRTPLSDQLALADRQAANEYMLNQANAMNRFGGVAPGGGGGFANSFGQGLIGGTAASTQNRLQR